jgi:hypothetical protein
MTSYVPQTAYRLLAGVSLVMSGLFAWELVRSVEAGSVLFFAVSVGLLLWSARTAWTKIFLAPDRLIVAPPLAKPRDIQNGQILSVSEEGRMNKSIVVAYHPRTRDGMLDLERAQTIVLPAVQEQESLYEQLLARIPA